jgi:hypothetical protein
MLDVTHWARTSDARVGALFDARAEPRILEFVDYLETLATTE